jgi:hypothetical protein
MALSITSLSTLHIDDTHLINKQNNEKQHTDTQNSLMSCERKTGAYQIQMLPRPRAARPQATGHRPQATGLPGTLA